MVIDDDGEGADELVGELVRGDDNAVEVERRTRVTVGITTTVAVDIRTPGDCC